jgi:hypothetical protein
LRVRLVWENSGSWAIPVTIMTAVQLALASLSRSSQWALGLASPRLMSKERRSNRSVDSAASASAELSTIEIAGVAGMFAIVCAYICWRALLQLARSSTMRTLMRRFMGCYPVILASLIWRLVRMSGISVAEG